MIIKNVSFLPLKSKILSLNVRWIIGNGSLCPWEPGKEENTINQWFPNISLNAVIWKLVRKVNSQVEPQNYWIENSDVGLKFQI